MPSYSRWEKQFAKKRVAFVGVHTPESEEEESPRNVEAALKRFHINYPVLIDNSKSNWNAWQLQYWPTVFLIDKQGHARYWWAGELEWNHSGGEKKMAQKIEELLSERYDEKQP